MLVVREPAESSNMNLACHQMRNASRSSAAAYNRRNYRELVENFGFFCLLFFTPIYIRSRDISDKSIDTQIILKLLLWSLVLLLPLFRLRVFINVFISPQLRLWVIAFHLLFLSVLFTDLPVLSLGYVLATTMCFWSAVYFGFTFRTKKIMSITKNTLLLICVLSVLYHLAVFGVPILSFGGDPAGRMKGIVQHPQMLGMLCGYGLMLLTLSPERLSTVQKISKYIACFVFSVTLVLSGSRTPILGMIIVLSINFALRRNVYIVAFTFFIFATVCIILVNNVDITYYFGDIARSGGSEEILTLNNRTKIWGYLPRLIMERPITGWGFGTIAQFLPEHAFRMGFIPGFSPPNTQNEFLELALGAGIPAALCIVWAYTRILFATARRGATLLFGLIIYQIFLGTTEPIPFKDTPGFDLVMIGLISGIVARISLRPACKSTNCEVVRFV